MQQLDRAETIINFLLIVTPLSHQLIFNFIMILLKKDKVLFHFDLIFSHNLQEREFPAQQVNIKAIPVTKEPFKWICRFCKHM